MVGIERDKLSIGVEHQIIVEFLEAKCESGLSENTLFYYRRVLNRFYNELFSELTPAETDLKHIETYIEKLANQDVAVKSQRRYLEVLSSFFSYALQNSENISTNPPIIILETFPRAKEEQMSPDDLIEWVQNTQWL